jgi:hypothetical protein
MKFLIAASLIIPDRVSVRCNYGKIARSILGHLVAARTYEDESVLDERVRRLILSPSEQSDFYSVYF